MGWATIKKAALVVFFVFGLSLFSAAQTPTPEHDMIAGGISYIPPDTLKKPADTTQNKPAHKKGKVKVKPAVARPQPKARRNQEPRVMGDVMEEGRE